MRGSRVYSDGIAMALSGGFDISKTSKFISTTDIGRIAVDRTYVNDVVRSFNSDTSAAINKLVSTLIQSGATADEIKQQLTKFKSDQVSRVNRFAKNESWRTSEIAGLKAMTQINNELNEVKKDGQLQGAATYKTWNIQPSACPICIDYAGISIEVSETFFGGISAPPAHVTCRCKLSYSIVKKEVDGEMELHCASCDRFLGVTNKSATKDRLKCPNSKCRVLEIPVVKAALSAPSQ